MLWSPLLGQLQKADTDKRALEFKQAAHYAHGLNRNRLTAPPLLGRILESELATHTTYINVRRLPISEPKPRVARRGKVIGSATAGRRPPRCFRGAFGYSGRPGLLVTPHHPQGPKVQGLTVSAHQESLSWGNESSARLHELRNQLQRNRTAGGGDARGTR